MPCPNCGGLSNQVIGDCCLCPIYHPDKTPIEIRACCIRMEIAHYCLEDDCREVICRHCQEEQFYENFPFVDSRECWCQRHLNDRMEELKQVIKYRRKYELKEVGKMNSDSVIERLKAEIERLNIIANRSRLCNHVHVTKGECWLRDHSGGNAADKHIYRSDLENCDETLLWLDNSSDSREAAGRLAEQILRRFNDWETERPE